MKVKEESEKAGLNKTQHSKTKIMEKKKKKPLKSWHPVSSLHGK